MKRFVIILLALLSFVWTGGGAKEVSQEQARQKALSFLQADKAARGARVVGKSVEHVRLCYTSSDEGTPAFYVFNADDEGFVIVSAEDRTEEILGYSASGRFDEENIPDALRELLQSYTRQIAALGEEDEWNLFTYIVEDAVDIYTGIGAVNATTNPKASFSQDGNTVKSATGKPLSVFDMAGRRVARGTTDTLKSGSYVIVCGGTRTKVLVR